MEIIEKKDNKIVFLTDIEDSLANAIRRYVGQIPVLAVDEVEISKNDSPLYDETIAHRIGLIPLKDSKKTSGKIKLETKKEGFVHSEEMKGDISVVYDKIPITLLHKGQELEFVASVKPGKGSEHSKFSPGLIFYKEAFEIKLTKGVSKEILNNCHKGVFNTKDGFFAEEDFQYDSCDDCLEYYKNHGKEPFELVPSGKNIVVVESFGQMNVEDVFKRSVESLKKDLSEVQKKMSK